MRRRRSVIAALPKEIREELNRKLESGVLYGEICLWLAEKGHPGIDEGHMMRWFHGGFGDWKREQEKFEAVRERQEFAADFLERNKNGNIQEAALQWAASQLFAILFEFDPEELRELLHEKPEHFLKVVNVLTRLSKGTVELERFKFYAAEERKKSNPEANKQRPFSRETIRLMEEALNLM